jgi:hypothetical protein
LPSRLSAAPMTSSSGCHSRRSWSAGLEPRHLQEVLHEAVQPIAFLPHRLEHLPPRRGVELRAVVEHRRGRALDRRQRRSQIVRDRAQQRVAQPLGLDAHLRLLRLVGEMGPLDGERGLIGEGLELMELIG